MIRPGGWSRFQALIIAELRQLTIIQASSRVWQMPFTAALASGLPLLVGAYFDHLNYGLVSSIGGLVFLYLPSTPMYHRMVWVMTCAFGIAACYALGLISHFFPLLMMPVLVFVAIVVSMICRFYLVGPPGSLFFVMAASIGAYSPIDVPEIPLMVGLIFMGSLLACLIAFCYSVHMLRLRPPQPVPAIPKPTFDFVVFDSIIIGVFVGVSLVAAQALQLQKAYWVPVSCLAVIQGSSLRAVWTKQLHRVIGTSVGLLIAWGILLFPLDKWSISLTMMVLTFVIEFTVVRHYAFAAAFITPLTILLAEAATLGHGSAATLIYARFADTILGCLVGLAGGICLHSPSFRAVTGRQIRRLIPARVLDSIRIRTE
jgi:hypothetical protein